MKAIEITKPYEINIIEKDVPKPKENEALLKVLCCGICGADVAFLQAISLLLLIREYPATNFRLR